MKWQHEVGGAEINQAKRPEQPTSPNTVDLLVNMFNAFIFSAGEMFLCTKLKAHLTRDIEYLQFHKTLFINQRSSFRKE